MGVDENDNDEEQIDESDQNDEDDEEDVQNVDSADDDQMDDEDETDDNEEEHFDGYDEYDADEQNDDENVEEESEDVDDEVFDIEEIEPEAVIDAYIESAICLHGRTEGQHQEIGDENVAYCFSEYDDAFGKPVYKGEFGEIRWTQSAGSYGGSYGLFLYESGEDWPIAYCFSNDAKDISVCDKQWFVDHGTSARYYKDDTMESKKCECSVDGFDLFDVETTMMPQTTGEDDDSGDAADSSSASTTESWSTVSSTGTIPSAGVNALETSNANKYGMSFIGIMLLSALAMA